MTLEPPTITIVNNSKPPQVVVKNTPVVIKQKAHKRQLSKCGVCGLPGILCINTANGRRYSYILHNDEPPIGRYRNGQPKHRICKLGRLYNSLEEMVEPHKRMKGYTARRRNQIRTTCEKCGKTGMISYYWRNNKSGRRRIKRIIHTEEPEIGRHATGKKRYRTCYIGTES